MSISPDCEREHASNYTFVSTNDHAPHLLSSRSHQRLLPRETICLTVNIKHFDMGGQVSWCLTWRWTVHFLAWHGGASSCNYFINSTRRRQCQLYKPEVKDRRSQSTDDHPPQWNPSSILAIHLYHTIILLMVVLPTSGTTICKIYYTKPWT